MNDHEIKQNHDTRNTYDLARQQAVADGNKEAASYWEGAMRGYNEASQGGMPLLTKEQWADKILADFKNEGNRTKLEEWEACYAHLFKQLSAITATKREYDGTCDICMGTGVAGHPDSGNTCSKCGGSGVLTAPARESGKHPLEYCTYLDSDGNRKFLTDFVPQIIASYEMNIQNYQKEQWSGAVYKAMEDALNKYFLIRIEGDQS